MKRDKNLKILKKQISGLRSFIFNAGFKLQKRKQYLNRPHQDFTRKRKLEFTTTITLILSLLKKA